jgi:HEAT repeat protein
MADEEHVALLKQGVKVWNGWRKAAFLFEAYPSSPDLSGANLTDAKLITALGDAASGVRRAAATALGRIGPAAAWAVPALITALGDADMEVRDNAAQALEQIGPAAVPTLITALGNANGRVRWKAAQALEQIGPAAVEAVPALITALGDDDVGVRSAAAKALGEVRGERRPGQP